jgi:hypothetical protein
MKWEYNTEKISYTPVNVEETREVKGLIEQIVQRDDSRWVRQWEGATGKCYDHPLSNFNKDISSILGGEASVMLIQGMSSTIYPISNLKFRPHQDPHYKNDCSAPKRRKCDMKAAEHGMEGDDTMMEVSSSTPKGTSVELWR